jgi:hypothetical protein
MLRFTKWPKPGEALGNHENSLDDNFGRQKKWITLELIIGPSVNGAAYLRD